MPAWI
jgi:hypothetical protein